MIDKDINTKKEIENAQSNILNLGKNRPKKRESFKWVDSLRSRNSLKINNHSNVNYSIKKDLKIEEMIDNAKIHREANLPLKKIKEFSSLTKFCQCCYLPVKDNIYTRNFNFCENSDEYAECGRGISLYFSYYRFASIILFFSFISICIPSMIITNHYTNQLVDICNKIYFLEKENINSSYPDCLNFIDLKNSSLFSTDMVWALKYNSFNLKQYRKIYNNISKSYYNVDQTLINYNLIHFIGLIALFIINILYIIILYNINNQYDILVTSPSDFTVIITNLKSAFKIFYNNIKKINNSKKNQFENNINKNNSFKDLSSNIINIKNSSNSSRFEQKEQNDLEELGIESFSKHKDDNVLNLFNEFIKNKICVKKKGEKFNIYQINICYKINEFLKIEKKIREKKNVIYKIEHDPNQKEKNEKLKLIDENRKYFFYPLDIFGLNIFPFNIWEKSITLSDIDKEEKKLEIKLKELMNQAENLTEDNFSGVVFVTFDTIKDAENFVSQFHQNFIMNILVSIKNLKYFLCSCFIDEKKKNNFSLKRNINVDVPPEPEDVIFENLQYSTRERFARMLLIYFISFLIICLCFTLILFLNLIQIKHQKGNNNNKVILKYLISIIITLIISVLNTIFRSLLDLITKNEKQISMTNYYLSYSVKLALFTFSTSGIIPFVSNYFSESNYDILVTNMLTIFLSNSFLTPIMWTIDLKFLYKKLKICYIEKYKKYYTQKELNNLYELIDMGISYKYSYIAKTLLLTFFYMPIFPLSVLFSLIGFIFGYFLEKFNFSKMYKKPETLNSKICEFYSNYFILNFFMLCIGDYIFLSDTYKYTLWPMINLIIFGILIIIPYNQFLVFDFIGIKESEIKSEQNYGDYYFSFYNDYERNNPITKKEGIKHFLNKFLENALISKKDYDIIIKNIENINILELYYKAKLNFTHNLIQRLFLNIDPNETKGKFKRKNLRRNSKFIDKFKEYSKHHKLQFLNNLFFKGNVLGNFNNDNLNSKDNNIQSINIMHHKKENNNNGDIYEADLNNFNNKNIQLNLHNNKFPKQNRNNFFKDDEYSNNQLISNINDKNK